MRKLLKHSFCTLILLTPCCSSYASDDQLPGLESRDISDLSFKELRFLATQSIGSVTPKHYKFLADKGDVNAQAYCGTCLLRGWGIPPNIPEAASYLKSAADQGNADGQAYYADILYGNDVKFRDLSAAAHYYKQSADQLNPFGQFGYGWCLFWGDGVPQDRRLGVIYIQAAADQGACRRRMRVMQHRRRRLWAC